MGNRNNRVTATSICAAIAALTAFSGSSALAAPLDISDTPLFLSSGVQPNLIMAIDDSGSMDFEVLFPGNDGSGWWRTAASGSCTGVGNSFIGCVANSTGTDDVAAAGRLNFNNAGNANATWKKYTYLFPNGCNGANTSFQRRNCDATNDHFAIPPLRAFAWSRSPTYNAAYFNPAKAYLPWRSEGGFTFGNSPAAAARFDPVFGSAGDTINLTQNRAGQTSVATTTGCTNASLGTPDANHMFKVYEGMRIPTGSCIYVQDADTDTANGPGATVRNTWILTSSNIDVVTTTGATNIPNGSLVAIRYYPATFWLPSTTALPAGFGYNAVPLSGATAPDGTALRGYEIKSTNFSTPAAYGAALQKFANWFTYYRKRHQALRAGLGDAFFTLSGMRVGGYTINGGEVDVTMNNIDVPANRTNLYTQFYQNWVRTGGTPNRAAVANMIRNYKRTGASAPIEFACQKNFGMLFTDGFSNQPAAGDGITGIGNIDGGHGAPYEDSTDDTMADAAMNAYVNTVRGDLAQNQVTLPAGCAAPTPDARLDCNDDPHMNFYAVTLGTRGLQFNPDANPAQDPYTTAPTWPTSFPARHPSAVDDIWHATINGRGELLNAKSSDELADKLRAVLTSIVNQTGSASSASVNSGTISSDTRLFQAKFDSRDWSGQLLAFPINTDGSVGAKDWDASEKLPAAGSRAIITVNSDGTPVPFRWANLDTTRKGQIDANATIGAARVDYLRGDATHERPAGLHQFRTRTNKLGDIVSSSPMFVGKPGFGYSDTLESDPYSEFRDANDDRKAVVYAGANDGMLHAFDAGTGVSKGVELLAFVPSPAYRNLATLSSPTYSHKFFVDGPPNIGDVHFDGDWETVLVGGMNGGGQGIFALKITDPGDFSEANADELVLWEFTDADDVDLGYTYAQPSIVRLHNGVWAAVFGNGYNNTEADGAASSSGNAVLYIVNIKDGSVIRRFDTGVGTEDDPITDADRPNGMSTPAVVDEDNDDIVDFVYAGDLYGNMWKIDIRSEDKDDWKFSFGTDAAPEPLFDATAAASTLQPITSRPEVIRGPRGVGMMVLFGTGKYLENGDKVVNTADPDVQAHYGLHDRNAHDEDGVQLAANQITALDQLVEQEITGEPSVSFGGDTFKVRLMTDKEVPSGFKGWYLNLMFEDNFDGERQISNTLVRNNRVIFTTLIPDGDPCGFGGSSWLMELNALTGGRLPETPFDLNNDGVFDSEDFASGMPVGGRQLGVGIATDPGVLMGGATGEGTGGPGSTEYKYNAGTTGEIAVTRENPGPGAAGRQSWRQIR